MPDYSLPPCVTLIFGRCGSGKTTMAFRYIANALAEQPANVNPAACVFIFDWKLEAAHRLGVTPAGTAAQCEAAVSTRLVCFEPSVMFQERQKDAFRWFCHWVFEAAPERYLGKVEA